MSTFRLFIALATVLCSFFAASAAARADRNPHVEEAREAIENLEYDRARAALGRASRAGDNNPDQLAEIFMWSGVVAGGFGEEQNAFDFFVQALTVDTDVRLPSGLAPKITKPFARARAFVAEHGTLAVSCEPGQRPGTAVLVTRNDPAGLVFGAEAEIGHRGETELVALEGSDRFTLRDLTSRAPVVLYAVDRFGNRVSRSCRTRPRKPAAASGGDTGGDSKGRRLSALQPASGVDGDRNSLAAGPGDDRSRPLHERWYLWGGTTVALAATGAFFGLGALSDRSELERRLYDSSNYDFAETRAIEQRGQRRSLVAGVTLGAAAVSAGVAVWMKLREGDGKRERATAVVAPSRGGASVAVSWSF